MSKTKVLNEQAVRDALGARGWTQKQLADEIGVTAQAVTNWLRGTDFPRPDKLLKLGGALKLNFDQLVASQAAKPIIAFRKKAGTKTTIEHIQRAEAMGALLKPLVSYLPARKSLRTQIPAPTTAYDQLQDMVADVRDKIGIGQQAVLTYQQLIGEFRANDAVIVPVMWGEKRKHENALHILLPEEKITFVYLNLDTFLEDFKFWMAHELAHVYTPEIAGTESGEDFADAFAGALLFPKQLARTAYIEAKTEETTKKQLLVLKKFAEQHCISLYSVYREICSYARAEGCSEIKIPDSELHSVRLMLRGPLVSKSLFNPLPPEPKTLIATSNTTFQSSFFPALQKMLHERETGTGYVQQVLDISIQDATALYDELTR